MIGDYYARQSTSGGAGQDNKYSLANSDGRVSLGTPSWADAAQSWSNQVNEGIVRSAAALSDIEPMSPGAIAGTGESVSNAFYNQLVEYMSSPSPGEFEGTEVAGPGARDAIRKVGASTELKGLTVKAYESLDDLNAVLSAGKQDKGRIAELRESALNGLNEVRGQIQNSAELAQEIAARGLSFPGDLQTLGMLGAFGDPDTVQRIAVATANAGGASRASALGISVNLGALEPFSSVQVNAMTADAGVLAAAPRAYMDQLLGLRSHVDSTMVYLASMTDAQMERLGIYTDSVIASGGMVRYHDNQGLAALFGGMSTTGAGISRIGEGISAVTLGLRSVASGLAQSIGQMNPELFANSVVGKLFSPYVRPMYAASPGASGATAIQSAATRSSNTTRTGVVRTNAQDWREVRDLWDDLGYDSILSSANRAAIARGRTPTVDDAWVRVFPEDAGLIGERIPMHHIGGLPVTIPLPATRHLDAHMPGGFRYNPGGPGSAAPLYPPKP